MKKLQAKYGRKYSFQADQETLQKLRHCSLFAERNLEVQASEAVLLRRAVALLVEHNDRLQRRLNKGKEIRKEDELYWLKRVSEPLFLTKISPIPEDQPMLTYEDRIKQEQSKVTLQTILKDASAGLDYRHGLHLANLKKRRTKTK